MGIFTENVMRQRIGYFNKNDAVVAWARKHNVDPAIVSDPLQSNFIVGCIKEQLGVDWLYGGWMEDRSAIWAATYLKESARFLHLGIDCWVSAGTEVYAVKDGPVLHVGCDLSDGGWGGHVVQLIEHYGDIHALIYAHLSFESCLNESRFRTVKKGDPLGRVGKKEESGGWAPHLHLQLVNKVSHLRPHNCEHFMREIDGYGLVDNVRYMAHRYPDPTPLIF